MNNFERLLVTIVVRVTLGLMTLAARVTWAALTVLINAASEHPREAAVVAGLVFAIVTAIRNPVGFGVGLTAAVATFVVVRTRLIP